MSQRLHMASTLRELQSEVARYLEMKGKKWSGIDNHYYLISHLAEEVGELAHGVINYEPEETDPSRRGSHLGSAQKLELIEDGLGDILFHLFKIAIAYKLDLEETFQKALTGIKQRYPAQS